MNLKNLKQKTLLSKQTKIDSKSILALRQDKSKTPITNDSVNSEVKLPVVPVASTVSKFLLCSNKQQKNIFIQNMNNKYKLVPFNIRENFVGETKYSPPVSKE